MITHLSVREQIDLISKKEIKVEELFQEYLSNIEKLNPKLNAIVSLRDKDWIIDKAKAKDEQKVDVTRKQILFGLPFVSKELFDVTGLPTTYGILDYRNNFPQNDSLIVKKIKHQGATIIGKSNMAELAIGSHTNNKLFDPVSNPYNYNLYGFRPSPGLISDKRETSKFPVLTTPGGIARTPDDLSIFLDAVVGKDMEDPYSFNFEGSFQSVNKNLSSEIKIGWINNFVDHYSFEEGIIDLCEASLNKLVETDKKIFVENCKVNIDPDILWETWCTLRSKITFNDISAMQIKNFDELSFPAKWEYEEGSKVTDDQVSNSIDWYHNYKKYVDSIFEKYDFIALPSAQLFPFNKEIDFPKSISKTQMDTYHRWMEVTVFASMFQLPTISVPVGFNAEGLPMGMQLIGKNKSDEKLIQIGKYYEEIFNHSKIKPNIING